MIKINKKKRRRKILKIFICKTNLHRSFAQQYSKYIVLKWSCSFFNILIFLKIIWVQFSEQEKRNYLAFWAFWEGKICFFVAWKAREGLVKRLAHVYFL